LKINILTSMFPNGFTPKFAEQLQKLVIKREHFVFVASEFEKTHEKTDYYFEFFLNMFKECGIIFNSVSVVDGRITKEKAQQAVASADVLWLAGGDTPTQYRYLETYGLIPVIKKREGITIGMSAGAINMARIAICKVACEHTEFKAYEALNLVDISVRPHLNIGNISDEMILLSEKYTIYGMCDNSAIICEGDKVTYLGDIFLITKGIAKQISFS
jgi:dipeptidase E